MNEEGQWTSITVGVSAALFVVWMQRHQRWLYFFNALTGRYVIAGSRGTGTTASSSSSTSTAPSTTTPPKSSSGPTIGGIPLLPKGGIGGLIPKSGIKFKVP